MVTTRPPKTIVKPTALGPVANTDTKLLIYGLFQKGRVLAQDGIAEDAVEVGGKCRLVVAIADVQPIEGMDQGKEGIQWRRHLLDLGELFRGTMSLGNLGIGHP